MKKKLLPLLFCVPIVGAGAVTSILMKNNITNFNISVLDNYTEKASGSSIIQQIHEGNFYLDQFNGIKPQLRGEEIGFRAGAENANMLCSGRNGYIIGRADGRGVDLISYSGQKLWQWKNDWRDFEISDSIYLPVADKYIVSYNYSGYGTRFLVLDPDKGLVNTSDWLDSFPLGNEQYCFYNAIAPINNQDGQPTNKFIIYPREWANSSSLKRYVEVTIGNDGSIETKNVDLTRTDKFAKNDFFILSAGGVQIGNDVYTVTSQVWEWNRVWITLYKNGKYVTEHNTGIDISWGSDRNQLVQNALNYPSDIDVFINENKLYTSWYQNLKSEDSLISYSFDLTKQVNDPLYFSDNTISLQNSQFDFDASNVTLNNGVFVARGLFYGSDSFSNFGAFVKINSREVINSSLWNQSNFNIDENAKVNNLYGAYKFVSGDQDFTSKKLIPLQAWSQTDQFIQPVALFCTDQSSEMQRSFQVIDDASNYPYKTKLKNDSSNIIELPNVSDITLKPSIDYTNDLNSNFVNANIIKNNLTQYVQNSTYKITSEPLSIEDATAGRIPATLIIGNGYNNASNTSVNVSINVVFSGFATKGTTVVVPSKPISVLSSYTAQEAMKSNDAKPLLYDFIANYCFATVPPDFSGSNIVDVKYVGYNNQLGTLTISQITVNNWISENGEVHTNQNHTFNKPITLSGFYKSKPTEIRDGIIYVPIEITDISKIATDVGIRKQVEAEVTSWIKNNFIKVFDGLPQTFNSDNVISTKLDISSIDKNNNGASFYINVNNVFLNNAQCEHIEGEEQSLGPAYFVFSNEPTQTVEEGIPYWVWIIVGCVILLIIIIIIVVILLMKKKKDKDKKIQSTALKKPTSNTARLSGPSSPKPSLPPSQQGKGPMGTPPPPTLNKSPFGQSSRPAGPSASPPRPSSPGTRPGHAIRPSAPSSIRRPGGNVPPIRR